MRVRERGGVLIMILLIVPILMMMDMYLFRYMRLDLKTLRNEVILAQAEYVGHAAMRYSVAVLKRSIPFSHSFPRTVTPPLDDNSDSCPNPTYDLGTFPAREATNLGDVTLREFNDHFAFRTFIWSYDPVNNPNEVTIRILIYYRPQNNTPWQVIKIYKSDISV